MIVIPSDLPAFVMASLVLAFVPGPDLVFVLTESMVRGRRAGLLATAGLCSGLIVHTAAVALGVAALVQASPTAFATLRYLGAASLLSLAWRAFHTASLPIGEKEAGSIVDRAIYRRAAIMNVTNPKVLIFFLAFLPQFAEPARGNVAGQMIVLGAIFMACSALCFSLVSWMAHPVGAWIRRAPMRQARLNQGAGLIFVALAVKLAFI